MTWPRANLDYVKNLADEVSERSVFGSLSTELAGQTRDVVEELRLAREVAREAALAESPTPWLRKAIVAYEARYGTPIEAGPR